MHPPSLTHAIICGCQSPPVPHPMQQEHKPLEPLIYKVASCCSTYPCTQPLNPFMPPNMPLCPFAPCPAPLFCQWPNPRPILLMPQLMPKAPDAPKTYQSPSVANTTKESPGRGTIRPICTHRVRSQGQHTSHSLAQPQSSKCQRSGVISLCSNFGNLSTGMIMWLRLSLS